MCQHLKKQGRLFLVNFHPKMKKQKKLPSEISDAGFFRRTHQAALSNLTYQAPSDFEGFGLAKVQQGSMGSDGCCCETSGLFCFVLFVGLHGILRYVASVMLWFSCYVMLCCVSLLVSCVCFVVCSSDSSFHSLSLFDHL